MSEPIIPSDGDLWNQFAWASGEDGLDVIPPTPGLSKGLRAVWLAGYEAGDSE